MRPLLKDPMTCNFLFTFLFSTFYHGLIRICRLQDFWLWGRNRRWWILLFSYNEVGTPRAARTWTEHVAHLYPLLHRPTWLLLCVAPRVPPIPFLVPTQKPLTLPPFLTFAISIKTPLLTLTYPNQFPLGVLCTNPYTGRFVLKLTAFVVILYY